MRLSVNVLILMKFSIIKVLVFATRTSFFELRGVLSQSATHPKRAITSCFERVLERVAKHQQQLRGCNLGAALRMGIGL